MEKSYKAVIEKTIEETKAHLSKKDAENKAGASASFRKAKNLVSALKQLEQLPGSKVRFSIEKGNRVEIRSNINDKCDPVHLAVEKDGTVRAWHLQELNSLSVPFGKVCGKTQSKSDIEAVLKRVTQSAVRAGLI